MNSGVYNRATLVLLPRFTLDAAFSAMEREHVTFFAGVPTMYWALLNHPGRDESRPYDLENIARHLRLCISGGAAMPVEVMRAFEDKFKVKILEGYGDHVYRRRDGGRGHLREPARLKNVEGREHKDGLSTLQWRWLRMLILYPLAASQIGLIHCLRAGKR